ncbi:hypothetical protein [uncultured Jatrophihabitans sp.]|uniref:hypothetical protein n=1 Tax=uncultured Jatrophihabitans sp. TaxID=1610747 RepID=UPI0035CB42AD
MVVEQVHDADDARAADLLLDEVEQRRRGWLLVTLGVLVSALAVAVPTVLSDRTSTSADGPGPAGDGPARQAAVYVAALSGGPAPHRLARRVYVRDRQCADVVSVAVSRCHGPAVPQQVQRRVSQVLGPAVVFRTDPPTSSETGVPVVTFGPLRVGGRSGHVIARLQMETQCGSLCGQGQTLVLRWHRGRWYVSGTTGPQWVG